MEDSNRLSYFLLGLGIGAAAAMMFAPKSGAETREYLQNKSRETADTLRSAGEDLRDRTLESIERGKRGLQEQLDNFSGAVSAGKQAYKEAIEETSHA